MEKQSVACDYHHKAQISMIEWILSIANTWF